VHFSMLRCMNVAVEAWRVAEISLGWAMFWRSLVIRCIGATGSAVRVSSSPGIRRGSPYMSSATDACRSSLNGVRILRRTRGSASVNCWSEWHMMAAFSIQLIHSMSPLAAGWWAVVRGSLMPQSLAREWKS
jgi:hypothetical protein